MKKSWREMESYVNDGLAIGSESVSYYEIVGHVHTSGSSTLLEHEIELYTELGEALSRFDELVSYGGRSVALFKATCDDTMDRPMDVDEPKYELIKSWKKEENNE